MSAFQDLTGQKFGRLTVIERGRTKDGRAAWVCRCDCGISKPINTASLIRGASTSCGCFRREHTRDKFTTHGAKTSGNISPEYSIWCNMLTRTTNKNCKRYADYGGRGVGVCEEWKSFETFLKDMGNRPSPKHSLDRIDGSKGYSRTNCKWSTAVEQGRNKRNNIQIEYRGETKCLSEWSETLGLRYGTLYMRITHQGMTAEEAFNRPVGRWAK